MTMGCIKLNPLFIDTCVNVCNTVYEIAMIGVINVII